MNSLLWLLGLSGSDRVRAVAGHSWSAARPIAPVLFWLIVAAGLALAAVNFLPRLRMRMRVRVLTALLRLAMIAVLLAVLCRLELHLLLDLVRKQQWLVMVDDSASMATEDAGGRSRFIEALSEADRVRRAAGPGADVSTAAFSGAPLAAEPGRGPTLIDAAVRRAALAASGLDRLVLLTDGRDTEGRDLAPLGQELRRRGIALDVRLIGGTVAPRDSAVFAEPERPVVRLGEPVVIRCSITSPEPRDAWQVVLKENAKVVRQESIPGRQAGRFTLVRKPPAAGRVRYTVELAEKDTVALNNAYTFSVDVVEEKIKVFMIEGYPRFEFKLMKYAVETDPMVELTTLVHLPGGGVYVQGSPLHRNPEQGLVTSQADLFKYDVVILRDVGRGLFRAGGDTSEARLRNIVEFVLKRGGGLLVLGGTDVYRAGGYEDSALAEVLPFDLSDAFGKDAQFEGLFYVSFPKPAYAHPILRLLPDPERNRERLNALRELDGSNNVGRFRPLAVPLMTRLAKIRNEKGEAVEREVPVMAYQAVGEGKVVAAAVDTLWRWQLQPDFDDPPLQALMANIIRYIAPPPRSAPGSPTVRLLDRSPQVGQEVVLSTTLRDKNYDPIHHADLRVTVTDPEGRTRRIYPRDLPEQPGYYEYRVRAEVPGAYEVAAEFEKQKQETSFIVETSGGEFANLSADRPAMERLADAAGGRVVESAEALLGDLKAKPAAQRAVRDIQVWNSPLVLLLFFGLVCADCYLRKRQGLP